LKIYETKLLHADQRGRLVNLISTGCWQEVNHIWSLAGTERGNHYHRQTRELFYILCGYIQATVMNIRTGQRTNIRLNPGMVVEIEQYELHTFVTETDAEWLNFLSEPMNEKNPDIQRLEHKP
jgi:dTDP-4-dehydrorhamnose 3,5-epimerase-like enzyme